jgi:putative toxin-antitoxin system antitoxin component (TIGR02293 family)
MNTRVHPHADAEGSVFARMARLLDVKLGSEMDAVRVVAAGLTASSYKRAFNKLGFSPSLVAPESTIRRRLATKGRFTPAESERLLRIARVYAEAVELFGDDDAALRWLTTAEEYLGDQKLVTPLQLSATDSGARLVESHIRRTAYGVF